MNDQIAIEDKPKAKAEFILVTGNANKARELGDILNLDITNEKVDLPELQSLNLSEVVEAKARAAYEVIKQPVLVDDVALTFTALRNEQGVGLPGPFIKFFLEALGPSGIADLVHKYEDHSALAQAALGYFDGTTFTLFIGEEMGEIVEPRGGSGFGWDSMFQPQGYEQTYAEMTDEVKNQISHRAMAAHQFKQFLAER
jgi:inosine triphosphate pyrophosphatase